MRGVLLVSVIVALGCTGGGSEAPPVVKMRNDAGLPASRDGGITAEAIDPLAPIAELLAPAPAADPNQDEILLERTVTARCKVKRSPKGGARDPDNSTVKIEAESLADSKKRIMGLVKPGDARDEFEAEFAIDSFPNGGVRFTCSVDDFGEPPRNGRAWVDTLLDLGPNVEILEPNDDSRHARKDPVTIKFEVTPAPLSADDDGAEISDIELRVLDQEFEFEEDPMIGGLYAATIDFDDRTRFSMAPTNADIVVVANNNRRPVPVQRRVEVNISLDAEGPEISITSPKKLDIVRGQIQLVVNIKDVSGVRNDTVIGTVNGAAYVLRDWEIMGDQYVAQFDTRAAIFTDLTELTINVTASDTVGNESTVDHILRLDNVAPLVSLDPPVIREWYVSDKTMLCSAPFDPVGDDAASDLAVVEKASMYRALVFERTNHIDGQTIFYVAGTDEGSMRLYARKKDKFPLLIDTDADGKCDDINSEGLDEEDRPVVTTLLPMEVRGEAFFWADTNFSDAKHDVTGSGCTAGTATDLPASFCPATRMHRAIHQPITSKPPAIYAKSPVNGNSGACQGDTWSLEPILREGWVCLAATVNDKIGNRGLSRPIRVCIDDGKLPAPSCLDHSADPPPSCVDGCTLPDEVREHYLHERL